MSPARTKLTRVLAIVPHSKGFGFAVFEGVEAPIDWGIKRVTGDKNRASLQRIELLINAYSPDAIVLEETRGSRRCERTKKLLGLIAEAADETGIAVSTYSYRALRSLFSPEPATKDELALRVAKRLPALRPRLPRPRKAWQSEDYRITIFVACALCMTRFELAPAETHRATDDGNQALDRN